MRFWCLLYLTPPAEGKGPSSEEMEVVKNKLRSARGPDRRRFACSIANSTTTTATQSGSTGGSLWRFEPYSSGSGLRGSGISSVPRWWLISSPTASRRDVAARGTSIS